MNAWVMVVSSKAGSASAARWVAEVPASLVRSRRVPTATAMAPASSAARTASAPSMPPAAITGKGLALRTCETRVGRSSGCGVRVGSKVALCPLAEGPWMMSPSAPRSVAATAMPWGRDTPSSVRKRGTLLISRSSWQVGILFCGSGHTNLSREDRAQPSQLRCRLPDPLPDCLEGSQSKPGPFRLRKR